MPSDVPHFHNGDIENSTGTNGPMDQWTNGPMDQWTNGPMDQWGAWRKAKASGSGSGCVEVRRHADGSREVRDSKNAQGHVLGFTSFEWQCFLDGAKKGEFDD